jgi:hypothetical protein
MDCLLEYIAPFILELLFVNVNERLYGVHDFLVSVDIFFGFL